MREIMTPWFPFGDGFRAQCRDPYHELEVRPSARGWEWTVERISPGSGRFEMVAHGVAKSPEIAKARCLAVFK